MGRQIKFRGDWYDIPEKRTLAELAYIEAKLDTDFDDLHSAQALLALTYIAVRRVRPKLRWDDVAAMTDDDLDLRDDDEPSPGEEREGEQEPTPPPAGGSDVSPTSGPPTSPDSATSSAGDPPTSTT